MPAFGRGRGGMLTDAQLDAIVSGLGTWAQSAAPAGPLPPYSAAESRQRGLDDGNASRGRGVFATYCSRCHGDSGEGGGGAGSVVDPAFLALTSDQALRTRVIVGRPDLGAPGWREYQPGRPIQDQEISDVVAWLAAHRGSHE
jgi:mono/diheme cytochrome c family protein